MQAVTLVAFVGATHCVLLAFVSYLQSPIPRASDKILTAILVIEGVRLFSLTAVAANMPDGPWLYPHPLRLAIGPLLLFYTLYLVGKPAPFNLRSSLHFTPVVLVTLALVLNNSGLYQVSRQEWLRPVALIEGLMFAFYGYAALRNLSAYRNNLWQTHSDIENLNLDWVRWVCIYVTVMGILLIIGVAYMSLQPSALDVRDGILVSALSTMIFCYMISLKGIQQSRYFERRLVEDSANVTGVTPASDSGKTASAEKYVSSALSKEDADHYYCLLVEVVERDKLYLRHRLKLADLANETGLHPQQVSQVINQCAEKHFYDFINGYRVEEVLRQLQDNSSKTTNILEIADSSGFNSPATFYKYFRKYTGKSPRRFLRDTAAQVKVTSRG